MGVTGGDAEPVEARPWRSGDGSSRTRSWGPRGPVIEVHAEGEWRRARVMQRQDWADGKVTVHVQVVLPSSGDASASYRSYVWDPRSMRPVEDAAEEPVETEWDAEGNAVRRAAG